ncbi:hypothetical protein [Aeoliella sp.]|uniref:hypothetical protein n=1 Tax=Aeoliella sp. TaxID=2795800 RepID=UPI003CCBB110
MTTAMQLRLALLELGKVVPDLRQDCDSIVLLVNRESYAAGERIWRELQESEERHWDERARDAADKVSRLFEATQVAHREDGNSSANGKYIKATLFLLLGSCIVALVCFSAVIVANGQPDWIAALFGVLALIAVVGLFQVRQMDDEDANALLLRLIASAVIVITLAMIRWLLGGDG